MSDLTKAINEAIPADLKAKFKSILAKFNIPVQPPAPAPAPAAPAQLQESTLADGTTIKYDTPTLSQGSVVTVVTPDGEMPCPEGEHTLQDGTKIKVASKDGRSVVESVEPAAAPAAPAMAAPAAQAAAPNPVDQIAAINKILQGYESKFSAQEKEKAGLEKELTEVKTQFNALKKDVHDFMAVFNELVDTPSAKPVEQPKNKFSKTSSIEKFINRPK